MGGGSGVDKRDLLEGLIGQHPHPKLSPLVDPLEGPGIHDIVKQANVGPGVLDRELPPFEVHS